MVPLLHFRSAAARRLPRCCTIIAVDHGQAQELLARARQQACKLLEDLLEQQRQLECTAALPPEQLAQGRAALARAVESLQRVLHNLDHPLCQKPSVVQQEHNDPGE